MPRNALICSHCGSFNPRAAVRCLDCLRDLRRHSVGRAESLYEPRSRRRPSRLDAPPALPPVYFTARSFARLEHLARRNLREGSPLRSFLRRELDRAVILSPAELGADIVEMGDRVVYRTSGSQTPENRRLVEPDDRHPAGDTVSVLSPVGIALLGLKEGSGMDFTMPDGTARQVEVVKVAPMGAA